MPGTKPFLTRRDRLRIAAGGTVAGVLLALVIVAAFGQLDAKSILAAIAAIVFCLTFLFLMGRWILPFARRIANRMEHR